MKTILVPVSGTESDIAVLDAAYALALPLHAHLDFIHIPLSAIDPSDYNRHIEFARGGGLEVALKDALLNADDALAKARAHVADYCREKNILARSSAAAMDRVTASWTESPSSGIARLVQAARAHDLTVVGRSATGRSWSERLLEALATETGRPVLIVPPDFTELALGTVAVWWKNHSAAARALTAALPLLRVAQAVALITVREGDDAASEAISQLSDQLGWHGIDATADILDRHHGPVADALWSASLARRADLVVMGGFSRSKVQEIIFGGCTRAVLDAGRRPVFMLH